MSKEQTKRPMAPGTYWNGERYVGPCERGHIDNEPPRGSIHSGGGGSRAPTTNRPKGAAPAFLSPDVTDDEALLVEERFNMMMATMDGDPRWATLAALNLALRLALELEALRDTAPNAAQVLVERSVSELLAQHAEHLMSNGPCILKGRAG